MVLPLPPDGTLLMAMQSDSYFLAQVVWGPCRAATTAAVTPATQHCSSVSGVGGVPRETDGKRGKDGSRFNNNSSEQKEVVGKGRGGGQGDG